MAETLGQPMSLSLGRRIICDLVHVGMKIPLVPIQKEVDVLEIVAARQNAHPRPSWCSIFTKAYAKVVAARPELRRAYLTFPWERMYQYNAVTADITVDALVDGENLPVFVPLKNPEACPLLEIDRRLRTCKENPLEHLSRFRRAMALARFPRFVRRSVWWWLLNVSARKRARHFGTFGVSSTANWGVDSLRPIAPCISLLHYGLVDAQNIATIRLTFDHRVMDGSAASKALIEMEQVLKTVILAELQSLQMPLAA